MISSTVEVPRIAANVAKLLELVRGGLSMVKRKPKPKSKGQRQARYTWRPVVELHWVVVRLNEDGSESFYSRYETEEEAKQMAATRDKVAREGRE